MNLTILYEDACLVACLKPAGVLSESPGMPELAAQQTGAPVFAVHRLDRDAGGVMLFARDAKTAGLLCAMIRDGVPVKEYLAVVHGVPPEAGEWSDLLYHDPQRSKTFVVRRMRRGVREASLSFTRLACAQTEAGTFSLVRIRLHTGRTHQIRAQFASRQFPLAGDARYGGGKGGLALFSASLRLPHPVTGAPLRFAARPESAGAWALFPDGLYPDDLPLPAQRKESTQ